MKIYTLTGDDGTTSLPGGRRVPKNSPELEAYGSLDELISWIGLLRDLKENASRKDFLIYIQNQLMNCAAALACANTVIGKRTIPESDSVKAVEKEIDKMDETLPSLENFILPGGKISVSYCHIARCVCRRAERAVLMLEGAEKSPELVNKFLNRLSDYLFILARKISYDSHIEEVKWTNDKAE